jgi:hypothetical protein
MLRVDEKPPAIPCAACAQPAIEGWEVWGHRLCGPCVGAWKALPGLDAGEVAAEVGGWGLDAMMAAWASKTAAWVASCRRGLPQRVAR